MKKNKQPHKLLADIGMKITQSIQDAIREDETKAHLVLDNDNVYIEMHTNVYDEVDVVIESYTGKHYPNIEFALYEVIPSWDDVRTAHEEIFENEWERNGFKNEKDFNRWKYC